MSQKAEASIVIVVAFGYFIFGALYSLLGGDASAHISEAHLEFLLAYELVVSACLCGFLYRQGWTLERLGLSPTLKDTLIGIGLAVAFSAVYAALWFLLGVLHVQPAYPGSGASPISGTFSVVTVIAVSAVNGAFEESFVCGYIVTVARENQRLAAGVNASIAIRLAYHLYQGGVGVVGIVPFGLLCALWFARTRRLWPVIIAHALTDLTSLMRFAV